MPHPFQLVADDILALIRRGEWKIGERIPAVRDLEKRYQRSRMTIHKALLRLQGEGYLTATRGSGTFVKADHVRDTVAIVAGGLAPGLSFSPLAMACVEYARAHFVRLGLEPRVYPENPFSASRLPPELIAELDAGRLKGLLAVMSSFSYRHFGTDAWRRHAVPYVDIGSQPVPQRIFIDVHAFLHRSIAIAATSGRRALIVASASGLPSGEVRRAYERKGVQIFTPGPDPSIGKEEWGFRLMEAWAHDRVSFDCVIAPDDAVAKGLAQGALAARLDVPRQMMIIALANRGADLFFPAPVTLLQVDVEALTLHAADRLLRLMREPALAPETLLIAPDREVEAGPAEAAREARAPGTGGDDRGM